MSCCFPCWMKSAVLILSLTRSFSVLHALFRVAKVFIIFNRRNYNNATLCQQNDFLFHLTDNPDMANNFQSHLEVLTEGRYIFTIYIQYITLYLLFYYCVILPYKAKKTHTI